MFFLPSIVFLTWLFLKVKKFFFIKKFLSEFSFFLEKKLKIFLIVISIQYENVKSL